MNQYTKNTRMNPESDNDELTIDLTEVIGALLKKAHIIILTGIIVALLAFIGTKLLLRLCIRQRQKYTYCPKVTEVLEFRQQIYRLVHI